MTQTDNSYPGQLKGDKVGVVDVVEALKVAASGKVGSANAGLVPSSLLNATSKTLVGGQSYWDQCYWDQATGND